MTCLQVVAHPDDDLFFDNPDIQAAITAGLPVATVFMTAGQRTGNGATDGARAAGRQLGVKAAYAQMAGIAAPKWVGDVLWLAGRQVERYTLTGTAVELVFIGLPDGGLAGISTGGTGTTVLPDGGLATRTFIYTSGDVLAVLAGLLARYQPTVVHAQDPLPDARYTVEHADHLTAAKWVGQAAAAYSDSLLLVNHRCYNLQDAPADLDVASAAGKSLTATVYMAYDSGATDVGWTDRMYHRWPRGSAWIGRNQDGRLQLFVVRGGLLWTWWQTTGGSWAGPASLGGGTLAPTVAVSANQDGRMQVFARRLSDHHIVSIYQTAINGSWSIGWVDHGSPNAGANAAEVGAPACAALGDGRMQLFIKNGGGGVSALTQSSVNGPWASTWADLGGSDVQGTPSAATNPTGCVELVAATRTGVLHWWQSTVGGPFNLNTGLSAGIPGSPPAAVLATDSTVAIAYRASGTAEVAITSQTSPGGQWGPALTATGRPGPVAPAAVAAPGSGHLPMLISRGADGHLAVAVPDGGGWTWSDIDGSPVIDTPAAVLDPTGAVVLAAVGMDGVVRVRTQTASGVGQPFGPWLPLPI